MMDVISKQGDGADMNNKLSQGPSVMGASILQVATASKNVESDFSDHS